MLCDRRGRAGRKACCVVEKDSVRERCGMPLRAGVLAALELPAGWSRTKDDGAGLTECDARCVLRRMEGDDDTAPERFELDSGATEVVGRRLIECDDRCPAVLPTLVGCCAADGVGRGWGMAVLAASNEVYVTGGASAFVEDEERVVLEDDAHERDPGDSGKGGEGGGVTRTAAM